MSVHIFSVGIHNRRVQNTSGSGVSGGKHVAAR
jgi:hypothetical protein